MPHLFISYSKKDTRELALNLADALNNIEGVSAWVDRSLKAGKNWELQIQNEIDRCDSMIVLYSPDINRHKQGEEESYVLTEIGYALRTAKKPIIPVMAQRTDPPISLTNWHYIDFTLNGLFLDDLVTALCGELDIVIQQATSPVIPMRSSATPQPKVQSTAELAATIRAIIGNPFDLCDVPAGEFLYGKDSQRRMLPHFAIGKYPITYRQFQVFVYAPDGFEEQRWWQGLAQPTKNRKTSKPKWTIANHPQDTVSWYDAVAFCRWLSNRLGGEYVIEKLDEWLLVCQPMLNGRKLRAVLLETFTLMATSLIIVRQIHMPLVLVQLLPSHSICEGPRPMVS